MSQLVNLNIDFDQEEDGRVIAEIESLPGCMVYGATRDEALRRVQALALRVIADKIEHGEMDIHEPVAGH
ncbi:HicB family protein [Deltaproteobacteria bacterium Smac51]|nr:HicB family protein [Deltaproteobacteria bacterium Smac51]